MKYQQFRNKINVPLFDWQDIRLIGGKVFPYQLSMWQRQGYLLKLKNGVYIFTKEAKNVAPEEVSLALYGPSYVSLEKALSYYGLIPEMVYAVTAVTPKTTRRIKNGIGDFIYRHVQPKLFFGYKQKKGKFRPYLLAEPEKALLDFIYLNRIRSKDELREMRINWRAAKKLFNKNKLRAYLNKYNSKNIKEAGGLVLKELSC